MKLEERARDIIVADLDLHLLCGKHCSQANNRARCDTTAANGAGREIHRCMFARFFARKFQRIIEPYNEYWRLRAGGSSEIDRCLTG